MTKKLKKSIKKYCFSALCGLIRRTNYAKGKKTFLYRYGGSSVLEDSKAEIVDDSLVPEKSAAAGFLCLSVA